jgi:hypothetical protein
MKFGVGNPCRQKRPIVEMSVEIIFPFHVSHSVNIEDDVNLTLGTNCNCIFISHLWTLLLNP